MHVNGRSLHVEARLGDDFIYEVVSMALPLFYVRGSLGSGRSLGEVIFHSLEEAPVFHFFHFIHHDQSAFRALDAAWNGGGEYLGFMFPEYLEESVGHFYACLTVCAELVPVRQA